MRYLIAGVFLLASLPAFADIDYTCMSRCQALNYQYQYCQEVCTYNAAPTPPPRAYYPNTSQTNAAIARGVPAIDVSGTLSQIAAMKMQQQQIQAQQAQMDAQRRLIDEQARGQQLENQRQEAALRKGQGESTGGSGPTPNEADRATFNRFLNAIAPRRGLYADFDSVVFVPDFLVTMSMLDLIAGSPYAADISYYLGKHKPESVRIGAMLLLDQAVAIKGIELEVAPRSK